MTWPLAGNLVCSVFAGCVACAVAWAISRDPGIGVLAFIVTASLVGFAVMQTQMRDDVEG